MARNIVNGAPMVIDYGTEDLSKRSVPREPIAIPQHLPKFYIFAEKGPEEPQLVVGSERDTMFGTETFNERGIYANHATVFANLANAQGNACMLQRLFPEDMGPKSNVTICLDVLKTTVDIYQRESDGSISTDALGNPIVTGTAAGYKVMFVPSFKRTAAEDQTFGQDTIVNGSQADATTGVQSKRYPIFSLRASSKGKRGDRSGFRLWAPTIVNNGSMPDSVMSDYKAYPYMFSFIQKPDELSSPVVTKTTFGEQMVMVTLKEGVIDPLTDNELYAGKLLLDSYRNLTDQQYPKVYGDFGELVIYQDNIDLLLGLFHAAEVPFIDGFSDITSDASTSGLFNFVTGVSSFGVPYHSYVFVDSSESIRFSEYTNVFASGGSDGTMTFETHAALAKAQFERYLDQDDIVQELAINVESVFYDSGYPVDTKYAMASVLANRKDTAVVAATFTANGRKLTASEEYSLAIALRTHFRNYPESDFFGTPADRAIVIGRSAKLRNSRYTRDLPLTAEILIKAAKYMGAGNGKWKNGSDFDGAPGSIIENMYDISITWVPANVRNKNWSVGLNWVQAYDTESFFFPAIKTIYDDDTSVLNSFITVMACCQLNKIAHAAWREYSGQSKYSDAQLIDKVNSFVNNAVFDKFDGRFVIKPNAQISGYDELRGYSWTLPIKIYAANMKTVMTTYTQAYRINDLAQG